MHCNNPKDLIMTLNITNEHCIPTQNSIDLNSQWKQTTPKLIKKIQAQIFYARKVKLL